MNIILIGPPASGKGELAKSLIHEFNLPCIEAGALLRDRARQNDALGREINKIISRGDFVPEPVIFDLITTRLDQHDIRQGFLLDGFPRTESQARDLDDYLAGRGMRITHVFNLNAPEDVLIRRMENRAVRSNDKRSDDKLSVFFNRLANYKRHTVPAAEYYNKQGLLRSVDANVSIAHTRRQAIAHIKNRP